MNEYTVWVGGVEVNDYYLSEEKAIVLAESWKENGYLDVIVEKVKVNNKGDK
jgi:hypothetical protein